MGPGGQRESLKPSRVQRSRCRRGVPGGDEASQAESDGGRGEGGRVGEKAGGVGTTRRLAGWERSMSDAEGERGGEGTWHEVRTVSVGVAPSPRSESLVVRRVRVDPSPWSESARGPRDTKPRPAGRLHCGGGTPDDWSLRQMRDAFTRKSRADERCGVCVWDASTGSRRDTRWLDGAGGVAGRSAALTSVEDVEPDAAEGRFHRVPRHDT